MNQKSMKTLMGFLLILLHGAIVSVALFAVIHAKEYANYSSALFFQCLGMFVQAGVLFMAVYSTKMPIGHKAPVVFFAVLYTLFLDLLNVFGLTRMESGVFLLLHLLLLFALLLVTLPIIYKANINK